MKHRNLILALLWAVVIVALTVSGCARQARGALKEERSPAVTATNTAHRSTVTPTRRLPTPTPIPLPSLPAETLTPTPELVPIELETPTPRPTAIPTLSQPRNLYGWITPLTASVHAAPNPNSTIVARLQGGETVILLGKTGSSDWLHVAYGSDFADQGWIAASQMKIYIDLDTLPVQAGAASESSSTPATPIIGQSRITGTVAVAALNVRSGPGTDYPVIGQLTAGAQVQVIGKDPSGRWLQFEYRAAGNTAWVSSAYVKLVGGEETLPTLRETPTLPQEMSTGLTGKIVFQTHSGGDIYLVNADGSGLRRLTRGMDPALSPDSIRMAFARWSEPQGIYVFDLRSGQERRLLGSNHPRAPAWSPDGTQLVFSHVAGSYTCRATPFGCISRQTWMAMTGGQNCLTTRGRRLCLSDFPERQRSRRQLAVIQLSDGSVQDVPSQMESDTPFWATDGTIVYRGDRGLQRTRLNGNTEPLLDDTRLFSPVVSPDGRYIAVQVEQHSHWDIFIASADGTGLHALTRSDPLADRPTNNVAPAWSPDGQHLVFLSDRSGTWQLYIMDADGSNQRPLPLQGLTLRYDFAGERAVDWGP